MNDIALRDGVILPGETIADILSRGDTRYTPQWFDSLPAMVDAWCERWQITLQPEIPSLSYTVVLFGISATEGEVVLKLAPPEMEFSAEIAGLTAVQRPGVVRLLHADSDFAGMLMQRVLPGAPLRDFDDRLDDAAGTAIGAAMLRRIWRPAPTDHGDLIPLSRWFRDLFRLRDQVRAGRTDVPLSQDEVELAAKLANDLLATSDPAVLHGDMHHGNVLESGHGEWTVIDPKGLVGDPAYDITTWLLNDAPPCEADDIAAITRRRVEIFARELGLPQDRLLAAALVHCALVIAWEIVDQEAPAEFSAWVANTVEVFQVVHAMATESDVLI